LFSACILIARVRSGIFLFVLGIGFIVFFFWRKGIQRSNKNFLILSTIGSLICLFIVDMPSIISTFSQGDFDKDFTFVASSFEKSILVERMMYGAKDVVNFHSSYGFIGNGAGTSGQLRVFLNNPFNFGSGATDSAVSQIIYQFGILGFLLLLFPLAKLTWDIIISMIREPRRYLLFSGILSAVPLLFVWYIFKVNSIIVNGFSQMIWFGILGICYGVIIEYSLKFNQRAYSSMSM
jgi:hypothetical protein